MTESVLKSKKLYENILIGENVGWKMVYNFLGKDEKTWTYFRLKHHCGKELRHFSVQCNQTKTM